MQNYPHRIRLRGPWQCEPVAWSSNDGARAVPPPLRIRMPCRWSDCDAAGFVGRARLRRRFGYPGRIDDVERVWLTVDAALASAFVSLNGERLQSTDNAHLEWDVTRLLRERNELLIEAHLPTTEETFGEVALEIRRTAYLQGVRATLDNDDDGFVVTAGGRVAGTAARPLDVYLLARERTVAQGLVEAGASFELQSERLTNHPGVVGIELVDAATVWYTSEVVPIPRRNVDERNT